MKLVLVLATLAACTHPDTVSSPPVAPAPSADESCAAIAAALESLRPRFPALVEFRASTAMKRDCVIEYRWHVGPPSGRGGGWTAAVPAPARDGAWFYVGLYDPHGPDANDQINTQPVLPDWRIGTRKVTFLIREGEDTRGLGDAVLEVLRQHGMTSDTSRHD